MFNRLCSTVCSMCPCWWGVTIRGPTANCYTPHTWILIHTLQQSSSFAKTKTKTKKSFRIFVNLPFWWKCAIHLSVMWCQPKMVAFHIISVQATTGPPPSIWLLHSGAAAVTNDWKRCCAVQKWCRAGGVDRYWYNFSYLLIPIHSILEHATFYSILLHMDRSNS